MFFLLIRFFFFLFFFFWLFFIFHNVRFFRTAIKSTSPKKTRDKEKQWYFLQFSPLGLNFIETEQIRKNAVQATVDLTDSINNYVNEGF